MESNIRVSGTKCRNCCSDPHGIKLPQLGVVAEKKTASGTSPVQLQVVASSLDRNPVLHQSFWRGNDSALFSKPEITMQGVQNAYDSF